MIYIPIELQLKWIREDLEWINKNLENRILTKSSLSCNDCLISKSFCIPTCPQHAPEFNMRLTIPTE
jgi:hypothetical protein